MLSKIISLSEEKRWLKMLRSGDANGLAPIYHNYKKQLLNLALKICQDFDMAEDVLHSVFISFASQAHRIDLKTSLKSYLAVSIINHIKNLVRNPKTKLLPIDENSLHPDRNKNPENTVLKGDDASQINQALKKLPKNQQEVILLHLMQDLTFREIAQNFGESINTVQSRYRYGLAKLKSLLGAEVKNDKKNRF